MRGRRLWLVVASGVVGAVAAACGAFSGADDGLVQQDAAAGEAGGDASTSDGRTPAPESGAIDGASEAATPGDAATDVVVLPTTDAAAPIAIDCSKPVAFVTRLYCQDFDEHDGGESPLSAFGSISYSNAMSTRVSPPSSGQTILPPGFTSGGFHFGDTVSADWTLDFDWVNDGMLDTGDQFATITLGNKDTLTLSAIGSGGVQASLNNVAHDFLTPTGWIHIRLRPVELVVNGISLPLTPNGQPGVDVKLGIMLKSSSMTQLQTNFDDVVLSTPGL